MQYTHWVRVLPISLVLGSRGIQVEAGCFLDLFFSPERNFFFFLWARARDVVFLVIPGLGRVCEPQLTRSGEFVLLECGSKLCTSFLTWNLGTGVGWATLGMFTSGLVAVIAKLDKGLL